MRSVFISNLIKIAESDERVVLLTGDLGYKVLEEFQEKFPQRFINVGIAEANMVGMAAGLALAGKIPYVFSIGTFATARCLEQIRNDICYQNLNVKIVGVGSGLTYSLYGASHHPIDDIALMRSLPNMSVVCPGDLIETKMAVISSYQNLGPLYLRLAAKGEPNIHSQEPKFTIGRGIVLRDGEDITIMVTGNMLANAKAAADQLVQRGISVRLISMPFVKPIDKEIILKSAKETKMIFSVEEHCAIGGLGSAIADILAEDNAQVLFKKISLPDQYPDVIGSRDYLRNKYGLSSDKIVETILQDADYHHEPDKLQFSKTISAVIACYRDSQAIPIMYERLTNVFKKIGCNYEIIYVNDASPDNAEAVLTELAKKDPLVTVINHSRNFNSQNAFISGMTQSLGDAVVLLDGDLQDPPEMIEDFVKKWLEGYDVVYGIRFKREASKFMQMMYKIFYRLLRKLSYINIPLDASDFSLMDRKVVNVLTSMPERDIFLRGLRAWIGYKQTGINYVRPERMFGRTANNLISNIRWAKKGIFSFSYLPLELISYLALIVVALSIAGMLVYLILYFILPDYRSLRGIPTLVIIVLFLGGIQLLCLSIIGEYLGKIFEEVKNRPKFIIKNIINNHKKNNEDNN